MASTKLKNFRLPLDLCKLLEEDERTQTEVVVGALRAEYAAEESVSEDWDAVSSLGLSERVEELSKTLPPATAQRIAELEAS